MILLRPPLEELPAPEAPQARLLHADLDEEGERELPHAFILRAIHSATGTATAFPSIR